MTSQERADILLAEYQAKRKSRVYCPKCGKIISGIDEMAVTSANRAGLEGL